MIKVSKILRAGSWGGWIKDEYWLYADGSSDYANGDIGDQGHESIAADRIFGEKSFEIEEALKEYLLNEQKEDPENFPRLVHQYREFFPKGSTNIDDLSMDSANSDAGLGALIWDSSLPEEVGLKVFGGDGWHEISHNIYTYYMKNFDAIRVVDNNFETWQLTPQLMEAIKDFVLEQADEVDADDEDQTINIEEVSTQRWASNIAFVEFENMKYPGQVFNAVRQRSAAVKLAAPAGFIVYLDMDGVLAAFDNMVAEIYGYPTQEREKVHQAMRTPGFFRSLDVLPGAKAGVTELENLIPGRIQILSAVSKSDTSHAEAAKAEKRAWLTEHFPSLAGSANIVTDKSGYGQEGDFLLDDHPSWNGAANFPGDVVPFKGPSDWNVLISKVKEKLDSSESSDVYRVGMVKVSRILL